jgi:soluble lytic murein transglycosylase-like protein
MYLILILVFSLALLMPASANPNARAIVQEVAQAHGVPAQVAVAVAKVESGFRCNARGRAGEQGLMQVKPPTARSVGVRGNLYDCRTGATAGVLYLRQALSTYRNLCAALSAYNRGLGSAPTCSGYGRKVMRAMGH